MHHSIHGETRHRRKRNTTRASRGIEHFCGNNPRQRPTSDGETEIIDPGGSDEANLCAAGVLGSRRKLLKEDHAGDKAEGVEDVSGNEGPSAAEAVD